jgi:hypothetical protein
MQDLIKSLLLLSLIALTSCKSEEMKVVDEYMPKKEIYELAKKGDPALRFKIPNSINDTLVNCYKYQPNCKVGHIVFIKGLEVKALEYNDALSAYKACRRIRSYRIHNWVFDDVQNEPVLEWFVKKYLNAEKCE